MTLSHVFLYPARVLAARVVVRVAAVSPILGNNFTTNLPVNRLLKPWDDPLNSHLKTNKKTSYNESWYPEQKQ